MGSCWNPTYVSPQPCAHLQEYRRTHGSNGYSYLQSFLRTDPNGRTTLRKLKSPIPRCELCSGNCERLYLCLICYSVSCSIHAPCHPEERVGHEIAVDMERAELFCCVCVDQVYDPDFDTVVMAKQIVVAPSSCRETRSGSKKRKMEEMEMEMEKEKEKKKAFKRARVTTAIGSNSSLSLPRGLRGLNNLGNTCFMNSVLQVFLHTPPLKNYFLSDGHSREVCCRRRKGRRGSNVAVESVCLACDVDGVFSAVFSGDRMPYTPARFLYSWWKHAVNLATYEQQDSHEFFISVLDRIHEKEKNAFQHKGNGDCHCIAHRVFSGVLRSDVTCTVCGFTSTTCDPCVDISLDLEPHDATNKSSDISISTLTGCLDLFTRPEKLGSDQKLHCQKCQVRQDTLKQMSIKRLPLVLCFHIKRFAHSIKKMPKKIDQYLQFPFSLDMTPYLSSSITRNRFGNRIFAFEGDDSEKSGKRSSEFEIFAVVTHSGKLESGHYVTYLRLRNQWYKCDDAWITRVDERVVRASQGYMIYYVQKSLYQRSCEDIACLQFSSRNLRNSPKSCF